MTRAVRDRILKDVDGNISDHLRNHVHLTNCIHLKNHMHKHSPILSDRGLMRDLVVLQRSRYLRDPSASPHSRHSPLATDMLIAGEERDAVVSGRRSFGLQNSIENEAITGAFPIGEHRKDGDACDLSCKNRYKERRRTKSEDPEASFLANKDESALLGMDSVSRKSKSTNAKVRHLNTERDSAGSSCNNENHGDLKIENMDAEAEVNFRQLKNMNRAKRRRFRGTRRRQTSISNRDATEAQNEISVASNSVAHCQGPSEYHRGLGMREHDDQSVCGVPGNVCGIPWNWSRIHDRGKSFIDKAGRSLSCGLSEPRSKKGISNANLIGLHDMPIMSENSRSSARSTGEFLPLLNALGSQSQGSTDRAACLDYSGELGIFADNLLKHETDSELMSEGRSGEKQRREMHQNITQKYMPMTFKDLVGQPLVMHAISNAVAKRKIGSIYLFYGPHGTGKTSCARIFARALNCQSHEHVKPCGICNSCVVENKGKNRKVREISAVSNMDVENIIGLLRRIVVSQVQCHYKVVIVDECDTLSSQCWNAILRVIDLAPRRVVFILVSSSLDAVPHVIISRCQKFCFPKLKDSDMIHTLQRIAIKEGLEIDKDALKLIASRSDGSLRDAEMTLEQLALLGKRISLVLVQELVGLISDEKLVDLLDYALSADTVNTVKNLRDIMETGVEPLALMSQLATVITDILAGSFDFTKKWSKRKFFCHLELTRDETEKLRQALKTLSETEKQLRVSTDRMTWLTAALLQLAPDQQYILPGSSEDVTRAHSRQGYDNEQPRKSNVENNGGFSTNSQNGKLKVSNIETGPEFLSDSEIEDIWLKVLGNISINIIREFMYQEAKLVSVTYSPATTVKLVFNSPLTKSKAEKFRTHILQAFESVFGSPVTIEIRSEPGKDSRLGPFLLLPTQDESINMLPSTSGVKNTEITEIEASPKNGDTISQVREPRPYSYIFTDKSQSLSLVRGKVSLANVIQQADKRSNNSGWSKRKAVSIAEKLEQDNLRLESRSRRLRCWKLPKARRSKVTIRRKPRTLLNAIFCGRCIS